MDAKPESLEELKLILSTIAQIREISLEVDFNLVDIEERYRTLHMYDIKTTTQEVETCNGIRNTWTELVYRSGFKISQKFHFKVSSDQSHFISEINVGKSRIRHTTTL